MMFIIWVTRFVELKGVQDASQKIVNNTDQFQDGDFHHTLVEVSWLVLHHFHRHDFVSFHVLTLDYLSEGALPENIKNQVPK